MRETEAISGIVDRVEDQDGALGIEAVVHISLDDRADVLVLRPQQTVDITITGDLSEADEEEGEDEEPAPA